MSRLLQTKIHARLFTRLPKIVEHNTLYEWIVCNDNVVITFALNRFCLYSRNLHSLYLTAISLHADIEIPVPSICFRAYSLLSFLVHEK